MKSTAPILAVLSLVCLLFYNPAHGATTGRSEDSSVGGTEKVLSDSSGTDTYITVSNLWAAPVLGAFTASGSGAFDLSGGSGIFKTPTGIATFGGSANNFTNVVQPTSSDGAALGTNSLMWADLFLASGAVINFDNSNLLLTHSSGLLTVGNGNLIVTTAGTAAGSVLTNNGNQTMTNKTATSIVLATGLTASGSASNDFSGSTGTFKTSTGVNTFGGSSHTFAAKAIPASDDGAALGDSTHGWSDGFFASGAVLDFGAANAVITHSSGILTMGTGELRITTPGTNAASVITQGSTNEISNKTLVAGVIKTGLTASGSAANTFAGSTGTFLTSTGVNTFKGSAHNFDAVLQPTSNDAAALGTTSLGFSDLFLATGGTIHFANTDWVATHTTGILTVGTGDLRITTAGTNAASAVTVGGTQTLTSKTFVAPVLGVATGTSLAVTGALTTSSPTAAFGYAAGAGGAVTQATSRTTGVTLSKTTGQITTHTASLAAGAEAEFTVTNTLVESTDTIILNITDGGTGTPFAYVSEVGAGSFKITVTNLHASTADTSADVINFTLLKGKSS